MNRKFWVILGICLVTLILWNLPASYLGLPGISDTQQRVVAILLFAALLWVLEPIPAWTTSVIVLVVLLLTASDSGLLFFHPKEGAAAMGEFISYKRLLHTFADPTIMLFLGGFALAIGASKVGLDLEIARILLKPFGTSSAMVLLGFILITGVFSMFLSNTATAAMMLTIIQPVLRNMPEDGRGRIALALAIPAGANLGGIATPIGTPPNAIALKYLNDPDGLNMGIGFGDWAMVLFPVVMILLLLAWVVLRWLFPFREKKINLHIEGEKKKGFHTTVVQVTFAITVLMWVFDKFTGVNANVVAMIPLAIFVATGVIGTQELKEINWSVLWMVAGGFALGVALNETGLASLLVDSIPFADFSAIVVILLASLVCWLLSTFISNTATAALMMPILAVIGGSMADQLAPLGGVQTLLMGLALSASLAMALPISTPPNALSYSTGLFKAADMQKFGLIVAVLGFTIGYSVLIAFGVYVWQ
ncbi:MAG: dihydroorotate dehydrogenase [Bacteroidia bacterium]|nr:MAG: dihydroorotate dehydrogenase [Bacteroidia bacterium]